jgi:hypothetical protein
MAHRNPSGSNKNNQSDDLRLWPVNHAMEGQGHILNRSQVRERRVGNFELFFETLLQRVIILQNVRLELAFGTGNG